MRCSGGDRASNAAYMLANMVSPPPSGGTVCICSTEPFVGFDHQDFRMAGELLRRIGMHVQLPEASPEGLVLFHREVLVTEEDHQIFHQRFVQFLELLTIQVL